MSIATAPVKVENIPDEMRKENRWIVWRFETVDERENQKVPRRPADGRKASSTDPADRTDFETAMAAYRKGDFSGPGFVLGDGWAGIDLDDCLNDSGAFIWGAEIVAAFASYGEVSPSGEGVKIFIRGVKPAGVGCSKRGFGPDGIGKLEVYDCARYFAVTGQILDGKPAAVVDCQRQLTALCKTHWPTSQPQKTRAKVKPNDDRHVERCRAYLAKLPTFHAAAECFRFGLSDSEALAEMETYNTRCVPPWSERELAHKVESARAKCNGEFGSRLREQDTRQFPRQRGSDAAPHTDERLDKPSDEISKLNTDIGNAERFAQQHRDNLRFCYQIGSWLYWYGNRWRWDESGRAVALGKKTALRILDEAQAEARAAANASDEQSQARHALKAQLLAKWAIASQKRDRIAAMLALAQPDLSISPDELDADPLLLNCGNGTVDLRTGNIHAHRREDFITKICRADIHSGITSPSLERCLARIFRTHPPLVDFMQRAIGYAATGITSEQCLFFLYGRGANGKTTIVDAAMYALGDYASKADPDLLMARDGSAAHPCNVADLLGRRMVVCSETNEGKRFDESKLKDLVGETRLKARKICKDFFEFTATHKIFAYSNHKPTVRGTDHGFWRRMKLVPFVETIGDEEKDLDLPAKLRAEADGVLAWIVAGAVGWHRTGLNTPPEVTAATADYRNEMDSIGSFLAEKCIEGERLTSSAGDLYAAYCRWCESAGEHSLSQRRLGTTLGERGYISGRCRYSNRAIWNGIGLKADPSAEKGPES